MIRKLVLTAFIGYFGKGTVWQVCLLFAVGFSVLDFCGLCDWDFAAGCGVFVVVLWTQYNITNSNTDSSSIIGECNGNGSSYNGSTL